MDDAVLARRRVERLLGALVALTAALLVGLAVAGVLVWREYARFRAAAQAALGDRDAAALLEDIAARQRRAAERLSAMGDETRKQIASFERRAEEIRAKGGGPIDTAEKAMKIANLMVDESLLALKQAAAMQEAMAKILPFGAGGGADRDQVEASGAARGPPAGQARRPPREAQPQRDTR